MVKYCLNLTLLWNILLSPSILIESFAGYSILGSYLCSLTVYSTSVQVLLPFRVSTEKLVVTLTALTLYVTWSISFAAFNILCFVFLVLLILCVKGIFYSSPMYLVFFKFLVLLLACISLG